MKKYVLLCVLICTHFLLKADEGLHLPYALNIADMQAKGLKLTAEDIYSINKACMRDAVVMFGGGCTGEVVSRDGLILTNHHCGAGAIQRLSSTEHNYTVNGYWAKNRSEELPCSGLSVTFTRAMYDVTEDILKDIPVNASKNQSDSIIGSHIMQKQLEFHKKVEDLEIHAIDKGKTSVSIVPFYYGNQYICILSETFNDIRLVGAPPETMGEYGGDEDNWVWPRHTADFSVFRIYTDSLGSDFKNYAVPYHPKYVFPISLRGAHESDFTMVYGYPGRTFEYLPSSAIKLTKDVIDPIRIEARSAKLNVWLKNMRANDTIHLQYAAKYSGVANGWKKWQGEVLGLNKSKAIEHKLDYEHTLQSKLKGTPYEHLIEKLNAKYDSLAYYQNKYELFNECIMGIERVQMAAKFDKLIRYGLTGKGDTAELNRTIEQLKAFVPGFYKDFNLQTDKEVSCNLKTLYLNTRKINGIEVEYDKYIIDCLPKSAFDNKEHVLSLLNNNTQSNYKKLANDSAYRLFLLKPTQEISVIGRLNSEIADLMKTYMKVQKAYMSDMRAFYPDANSTLRVAYGKVEGFSPRDAYKYKYYTTIQGAMDKHDKDSITYSLPARYIDLFNKKDFGSYADADGTLHTCFIASNHTTGGNSGSPVLNGKGELIGINFDRCWEGTMSDYNFDPKLCRNIAVDIRYVLWVMDKFGGAGYLIKEMNIQ